MLYLSVSHASRLVTRDQILDTLWGVDAPASNVADRLIRSLRRRLDDDCRRPVFIATVRGRGYRLLAVGGPVASAGQGNAPWWPAAS